MITIFNRKELRITYSYSEKNRMEDILKKNHIEYITKTMNRLTSSQIGSVRSRIGMIGQNNALQNEYIIYVKRTDYEYARHCLNF
ncbi:MAG: hypothetical protein PHC41_15880 [Lachnospiraceae bacterium]|nr:hypothetical protein [Lachnospiraceae bacterium]MDD3617670.1 hypothetical protein [Lachnospiraceae bacterium]